MHTRKIQFKYWKLNTQINKFYSVVKLLNGNAKEITYSYIRIIYLFLFFIAIVLKKWIMQKNLILQKQAFYTALRSLHLCRVKVYIHPNICNRKNLLFLNKNIDHWFIDILFKNRDFFYYSFHNFLIFRTSQQSALSNDLHTAKFAEHFFFPFVAVLKSLTRGIFTKSIIQQI